MHSQPPASISPHNGTGLSLRRLSQGFGFLLIVGLCIANVFLIKQNRALKAAIGVNQPDFLKPGQPVPSFAANTVSGQRQRVDYAARAKTVLLVFATQCPACERSLPYWKAIKVACDRDQYQIFGISLDSSSKTAGFLAANGLNLEVFAGIDADFRNVYKLNLTPLTIAISNNGKVEKIWPGAFNETTKAEMESYFGISPVDVK